MQLSATVPWCSQARICNKSLFDTNVHSLVMPFQCFFPIELLFNERNNWFSIHRSSIPYTNVIYSPFNTEYTSSDSLPSHSICMCFMLGPEWICMAKTKFQQDKGSLEIWTETDKEEAFIYLSAAYRSVGGGWRLCGQGAPTILVFLQSYFVTPCF